MGLVMLSLRLLSFLRIRLSSSGSGGGNSMISLPPLSPFLSSFFFAAEKGGKRGRMFS